ncbi:hypothetical protein FKW77_005635 [Venturia effusa]|uniref:Uncharacterized protein n=1 Tax=Venturia effusa TaxID=50376 RepID=A0A517L1E3_9PEZI|nr:hypothetical protein FKW77_005635 [Venturia effusa]
MARGKMKQGMALNDSQVRPEQPAVVMRDKKQACRKSPSTPSTPATSSEPTVILSSSSPLTSPLPKFWLDFNDWFAIDSTSRPKQQLVALLQTLYCSLNAFETQFGAHLHPTGLHASIKEIAKEAVASIDVLEIFAKRMAALGQQHSSLLDLSGRGMSPASATFLRCHSVSRCYELREILPRLSPIQQAPRSLQRTVELLRVLYHFQRAYTTVGRYTEIHATPGKLHFTTDHQPPAQFFFMFRPAPFSECENERDMEAILTTDGCDAVDSQLAPIIDLVLHAISKSHEVCAFVPKNCPRVSAPKMRYSPQDITNERELCLRHKMLLITMNDGTCFALDLTGAQYGWDEVLLPWKQFHNTRVAMLTNCVSLDFHRYSSDMMLHFIEGCPLGSPDELCGRKGKELVGAAMLDRIKIWLRDEGLDMKGFLELGESYDIKAFELVLYVVQGIEATLKLLKKDSKFYYYRGKDGKVAYAAH